MDVTVNVQEAKTRLSELLRRVEAGDEIVIARAGKPIARIQASSPRGRNLNSPLLPELPPIPADSLFEEMTEQEVAEWEGGDPSDPLVSAA
ncbi:type II toxin-antitoxin system prevent-host-death family antitoxin [Microbacterium bovistercoris]|uniref:Antitoxin n=1 Tax=Microbacterium bovistercoris TaxID=2293570 RepID=A0A371NZ49_9MICO|nr:type II toxin-antitoxin system prevent-host-death family antitoxin [Microbacterium bovistercoris]REJ08534.1 type II toxin-antitoxin system prevent-host-death family antitoxin [Microbacterium bovistercoris]